MFQEVHEKWRRNSIVMSLSGKSVNVEDVRLMLLIRIPLISCPLQIPFPALTFTDEYPFSEEFMSAFHYYRKTIGEWNTDIRKILRDLQKYNTLR
jgi:hypothetical protein